MRCQLVAGHAPAAFALSSLAGWNQTVEDWRVLLSLSDACLGIEIDGKLVATATLICYGQRLGWIGMVLTHPDFRRRGFARSLVSGLMEHAKALGLQSVKLDATDQGRDLYESLGIRAEQPVERWQRGPGVGVAGASSPGSALYGLDAEACGYDRGLLLQRLAALGSAAVTNDGYVLDRPGRINRYLGPCVALRADSARSLIEDAIARHPDSGWFWDLLPANHDAVAIARELGFECVRKLTRMTWGEELRGKDERIFALGGFEFG